MENIPYMREWLGYHIHLGVDKFFLYDNSKAVTSEWKKRYDTLISEKNNKYGLRFDCYGLSEKQVEEQWREIWADYYEHIVVIRWEPHNENGEIIYGQVKSLEHYTSHFKNTIKYTSFIDTDEFIFSTNYLNIYEYLEKAEKNNLTHIKMRNRHYAARSCVRNKRVTEIEDYLPELSSSDTLNIPNYTWDAKSIVMTKYYVIGPSIHMGRVSYGNTKIEDFD